MKKLLHGLLLAVYLVFVSSSLLADVEPPFPKPVPIRDQSVMKFLESTVLVLEYGKQESNWMGSGSVICYKDGYAYVLSCAHIFDDKQQKKCGIGIYYKDGAKLKKAIFYDAEVLGINDVEDLSFIKFKIDYHIPCFKVAPLDYQIVKDTEVISSGCDQNVNYIASYKTIIHGITPFYMSKYKCASCGQYHDSNPRDMIETYKTGSCRHGRSGGGLVTWDYYLVGVCSRGREIDSGTSYGWYMHFKYVHEYAKKLGIEFVLQQESKLWKNAKIVTEHGVISAREHIPH